MSASFLVVGCGSIGMRHIRNLRSLGIQSIAAVDPVTDRLELAVREFEVIPCSTLDEGLERRPEATLISTPPHVHTDCATRAIEAGSHVFVEKPIADCLDGLDYYLDLAERRRRIVCVGYNWRFHPGIRGLKQRVDSGQIGRVLSAQAEFGQYLPDWRPERDYRETYTAVSALGGGIVLDGSHEIDYLRWFMGDVQKVYCTCAKLSALEIDVEDTAELTLMFEDGAIAQLHLDCVQRGYTRRCKLVGEDGTLVWDAASGIHHLDQSGGWKIEPIDFDLNQSYVAEMGHFLACMAGDDEPLVDGREGKRVLEVALGALRSAAAGREIKV